MRAGFNLNEKGIEMARLDKERAINKVDAFIDDEDVVYMLKDLEMDFYTVECLYDWLVKHLQQGFSIYKALLKLARDIDTCRYVDINFRLHEDDVVDLAHMVKGRRF